MKRLLLVAIFLITVSITCHSQSIEGTYARNIGDTFICTLVLQADSTFTFHYYQKFDAPNPNKNIFGKGTWALEKNIVSLFTNAETEINKTDTLNFTNSKARYIIKSPRDTSNRYIKTALKFYESDISWVTGMNLQKLE